MADTSTVVGEIKNHSGKKSTKSIKADSYIGPHIHIPLIRLSLNQCFVVKNVCYKQINDSAEKYMYFSTSGGDIFDSCISRAWYKKSDPDTPINCEGDFINLYNETRQELEENNEFVKIRDGIVNMPKNKTKREIENYEKLCEQYMDIERETFMRKFRYKQFKVSKLGEEEVSHWSKKNFEQYVKKSTPDAEIEYKRRKILLDISNA